MSLSIKIPQTTSACTSIPLFADKSWVLLEFKDYKEKPGDKGVVGTFEWHLVQPAPSNQGHPIEPGKLGSKFFDSVFFFDKNTPPGEIPARAISDVSKRIDGCLGTGDQGNKKNKPDRPGFDEATIDAMRGKQAWFKMAIDDYGQKVKEIRHPSDMPNAQQGA